jgi:hypothetical protein
MAGLEVAVLLKVPSAGISGILAVSKAIKAGAKHVKAEKEYQAAVPRLVRLVEELRALAKAQVDASSIITEFAFFSSGLAISDVTSSDIDRKFDRFNDQMVEQDRLAKRWVSQIDETRIHCHKVTEYANELDGMARSKKLKNLFGLLSPRTERLDELRRQLDEIAEDDYMVIEQYRKMADAVTQAITEINHALYLGDGNAVERLKTADAVLSARAADFRLLNEQGTEILTEIREALDVLEK